MEVCTETFEGTAVAATVAVAVAIPVAVAVAVAIPVAVAVAMLLVGGVRRSGSGWLGWAGARLD